MKTEGLVGVACGVWERTGDGLLAAGLFVASLAIYTQTLAPSVATLFDDSLEFLLVCHQLRIAHPTGYPLYTLLGKLFTLGPWANVAWAVNFLSAVAGALTVALVYLVARQLTRRRFPPLLGALALATSPVFWSQSVIAEVYTLNSAFVAALLWLALRWARRPLLPVVPFSRLQVAPGHRGGALFLPGERFWLRFPLTGRRIAHRVHGFYRRFFPPVPPKRRLRIHPLSYGLAALYGLSLTHHRTMLLLLPAMIVFVLLVERRALSRAALLGPERPQMPRWLQVLGRPIVLQSLCLAVPLLFYLYLPARGHVGSLDGTYANTWRGFWRWVTASGYDVFLGDNPLARDLEAAFYGDLFWQQFGPVGLAMALVGLIGLVRQRKALVLTGLAFATYVVFAVVYRVPDVEVFFVPAFLLVAVWIGVGLDLAADLLRARGPSLALRRLLASCLLFLFVAAIAQPVTIAIRNYPHLDLSRRWIVHDYAQYVLEELLPANSTVVGILGETTLLRYVQDTTGLRADVKTIAANDEGARRKAIDTALAEGRAVYITRPLPALTDDYALDAATGLIDVPGDAETLIHVGEPSRDVPDLPRPTDLEMIPGLELLGYGLREHHGHWQAWTRLRLWWRAPQGLSEALKVSARLIDAGGQTVAAVDAEPVSWAYPTTVWRPGEVVADAYEIPLPAGLPPGDYRPLVIVYNPATGTEQGRAELAPVYLQGNPARPPRQALKASVARTAYARFGDVELLGFTPPAAKTTYGPGDTLPLTLLWQAQGKLADRLQLVLWLEANGSYPLFEGPLGGHFPTDQWGDGQTVRQALALGLPDIKPPGAYRLKMRVLRGGQPIPWGRGWIPLGSDLDLGPVQVVR